MSSGLEAGRQGRGAAAWREYSAEGATGAKAQRAWRPGGGSGHLRSGSLH